METRINPFTTANDTEQWAVIVDKHFGLFVTEAAAQAVYATIGGYDGSDGAANTPFGNAELLPPGYQPRYWDANYKPEIVYLTQRRAIDIENYIHKAWQRWYWPQTCKNTDPLASKHPDTYLAELRQQKEWDDILGPEFHLRPGATNKGARLP